MEELGWFYGHMYPANGLLGMPRAKSDPLHGSAWINAVTDSHDRHLQVRVRVCVDQMRANSSHNSNSS